MNPARTTTRFLLGIASLAVIGSAVAQTIKIGMISTYSGPEAAFGEKMDRGMKLYLKLNANQLPPGVKVEVITRDDGGPNPDKAKQIAQELIVRDKVHFLTGVVWTPNAMAMAPLTAEAKVPFIIMNAGASVITTRSPYIARVSFTMYQASVPLGEWAARKYKRAYTAVSDFSPGHDSDDAFERGFKKGGGEVIGKLRMPVMNADFVPFLQRMKDAKPDVIYYFVPAGRQATAFVKAYTDLALAKEGIALVASTDITTDEELPDAALGMMSAYHYSASGDRPANKAFVAAFKKEYGESLNPEFVAVAAWDAMDMIYRAIREQNGKLNPDRTMELMKTYKNPNSPRGPIYIDPETRDIVHNEYLREVRRVGGKLMNFEIETIGVGVKDLWKEINKK
ncbi:MAG: branched-chain amino acid ABC transporter substrate-binding protein [Betaproteobacteria bacterium]|nr:branched-chain amino acid ABC transporter substrate-binding protein [Betaproteobacteria bacterium]